MKLSEYPRPPADNGRGIHWSPSQYQWGRKDWLTWQKRILELGFKWIKVNVPPDYNAEAITKRLIDIGVMPVCRFIRKNPTRIDGSIAKTIERLVKLGVRYFETNNEPDADVEWVGYRRPSKWEEVVIQNLIHDANLLHSLGAFPAFVAFNTGPTEPRNPIQILLDTPGGREIFDKGLWVSLHNYGKGRPINYPNDRVRMFGEPLTEEEYYNQGQPDFWTKQDVVEFVWHGMSLEEVNRLRAKQKNPNITIMEDITCFRAFEYWNRLITQEGLPSIPIMMTEGGWETGDRADPFYPEPTAQRASELNFQMFQFIQGDLDLTLYQPDGSTRTLHVPDYFFAVMPWHMGEKAFGLDTSGQWEQGAWFTHWHDEKFGLNGELPIIQMLRELPSRVRANGPVPPEWAQRKDLDPGLAEWDYRFKYLGPGIRLERAAADGPRWEVVAGYWQDRDEVHPTHPMPPGYIMVKVLDEKGDPIPDARVEIERPGEREPVVDIIITKGAVDRFQGNYRMSATLGTYTVRVTHNDLPSDSVRNVGLGGEEPDSAFDQTSFLFIFQLTGLPEQSAPAETESPAETETATPAAPSTETPTVVNQAEGLGVEIGPMPPQPACAVVRIERYVPGQRMAPNMLYVDVLTPAGERAFGAVVLVEDSAGRTLRVPIEKPLAEPGGNMPMWPHNTYTIVGVEVGGERIAAQRVTGLRAAIPGRGAGHTFHVTLQLPKAQS